MKILTSKIQYQIYEKGEFSEVENRSLEDTLSLIHSFPWEEERNEAFINLNGPSITIEQKEGRYLKLGVYYYGMFMLYYLNEYNKIFCKGVDSLNELDKYVEAFFNDSIIEGELHQYRMDGWSFNKRKYFETRKFEYRISLKRALCLLHVAFIICAPLLPFLPFTLHQEGVNMGIIVVVVIWTGFLAPHILLFLNYYFFSRNLYLEISRGHDIFYYGKKGQVQRYSKKEIKRIDTFNNQAYRNPWSHFYTFKIELNDGTILKLTNLMISNNAFCYKFPYNRVNDMHNSHPTV